MSQVHPQPIPGAVTCVWAALSLSMTELLNGSLSSRLSLRGPHGRGAGGQSPCAALSPTPSVINAGKGGPAPWGGLS